MEIGEIELWYIDGSRTMEKELDIAGCEERITNDVLRVHALLLQPEYHGQGLEARIVWKIAQTIGYHFTAVVRDPEQIGIGKRDELGLRATKNSQLFCLTDF